MEENKITCRLEIACQSHEGKMFSYKESRSGPNEREIKVNNGER